MLDIFWLVVGGVGYIFAGGGYILAGSGWWWMVA